jgi:exonuclease III
MKKSGTYILLLLYLLCFEEIKAQSKDYYYENQTRYGTFRNYINGGSKLVSGVDYAAEMAKSQEEARQMTAERQRQRQIELERMRQAQFPKAGTNTSTPQKNYGPTPADLARQAQEEKDGFYRQYEELLENAKDLSAQALVLSEMNRLRPGDDIALRLFGVYAELGREEEMDKLYKSFSPTFRTANEDIIWAGFASKSYRKGTYDLALYSLSRIKTADLNSFAQNLCSRLRLSKWDELPQLFENQSNRFTELSPMSADLTTAFKALQAGRVGTPETKASAEALYRFAIARRERGVMDFVNILALDAAVSLEPENSSYREERFNSNSILKFKHAMQEDYDFFNK